MESMATGEGYAAKAPLLLEAILLLGVTLALATTFIGLYAVPGNRIYESVPSTRAVLETYGFWAAAALSYLKAVGVVTVERWTAPRIARIGGFEDETWLARCIMLTYPAAWATWDGLTNVAVLLEA